jgi:hypothetical protein
MELLMIAVAVVGYCLGKEIDMAPTTQDDECFSDVPEQVIRRDV